MRHDHQQPGQTRDYGAEQGPVQAWVFSSTGGIVLGLITVSVLLATESASNETYGETIAAVVLAMVIYWLAHSYSAFASWRIQRGEPLTPRGLAREMWNELPLLTGAALPLLAEIFCWAAGVNLDLGIKVGLSTAAVLIVVTEIFAGIRAQLAPRELLIQSLVGAALGVLVLVLRLALH